MKSDSCVVFAACVFVRVYLRSCVLVRVCKCMSVLVFVCVRKRVCMPFCVRLPTSVCVCNGEGACVSPFVCTGIIGHTPIRNRSLAQFDQNRSGRKQYPNPIH